LDVDELVQALAGASQRSPVSEFVFGDACNDFALHLGQEVEEGEGVGWGVMVHASVFRLRFFVRIVVGAFHGWVSYAGWKEYWCHRHTHHGERKPRAICDALFHHGW
jgi:hypothetical protein